MVLRTTAQASERLVAAGLDFSPDKVADLARRGAFAGADKDPGGKWQIPEPAVTAFIRSRRWRQWGLAASAILSVLVIAATLVSGLTDFLQLSDRLQPGPPEATASPPLRPVPAIDTDAHAAAEMVVFNVQSKKYHCPTCHSAVACTTNCIRITLAEAVKRKGTPCKTCGGRCK